MSVVLQTVIVGECVATGMGPLCFVRMLFSGIMFSFSCMIVSCTAGDLLGAQDRCFLEL